MLLPNADFIFSLIQLASPGPSNPNSVTVPVSRVRPTVALVPEEPVFVRAKVGSTALIATHLTPPARVSHPALKTLQINAAAALGLLTTTSDCRSVVMILVPNPFFLRREPVSRKASVGSTGKSAQWIPNIPHHFAESSRDRVVLLGTLLATKPGASLCAIAIVSSPLAPRSRWHEYFKTRIAEATEANCYSYLHPASFPTLRQYGDSVAFLAGHFATPYCPKADGRVKPPLCKLANCKTR